jgi:hypothetical protein
MLYRLSSNTGHVSMYVLDHHVTKGTQARLPRPSPTQAAVGSATRTTLLGLLARQWLARQSWQQPKSLAGAGMWEV